MCLLLLQLSPSCCVSRDHKVVRLFARRPFQYSLPQYYPPIQEMNSLVSRLRHKGLYRDEHLDFKEMMAEQRKARGKGKPKKGKLLQTLLNASSVVYSWVEQCDM